MRTLKIGVVGYSAQKFDEAEARGLLAEGVQRALRDAGEDVSEVDIVSGLTDLGIPALAYRLAVAHGWMTTGIACSKAEDYECFPVERRLIVGDNWGDESPTFLADVDVLVRVGGGKQSLVEAEMIKQLGKLTYEFDLPARAS